MATLREHVHVFKKDITNYIKSFLILLIMDIALTCVIALGLFQIVECVISSTFQQQNEGQGDQMLWKTSQKLCQSYKAWNMTTTYQDNEQKTLKHLQELCVNVWQSTQTSLEPENNKCNLSWVKFTKWFYFASMTAKALGQSQQIRLTSSGKLFLGFFNTMSVIFRVVTYIVGMMLFSTCIKLFVYTMEIKLLKRDSVLHKRKKFIAITSFFSTIAWLVATSLLSFLHPSLSYGEAFYGVLCDMLTVGYNNHSIQTPWYDINRRPWLFTLSLLLYYVQMSLVTSLFKMIVDGVITKRSGICCMALIGNESKTYNVTCPKCLVVEMELEQIKKMRELRQSVA